MMTSLVYWTTCVLIFGLVRPMVVSGTVGISVQELKDIQKILKRIEEKLEIKLHKLEGKIDKVDNDVNDLRNSMRSQTISMEMMSSRVQSLTDSMPNVHIKLDSMSQMETKLDSVTEQLKDLSSILTRQHVSATSKVDDQHRGRPDNWTTMPSDLVFPSSAPNLTKKIIDDFLEEAAFAVDGEDGQPSPAAVIGESNPKTRQSDRNSSRGHSTRSDLLQRLWRKFTKPMINVGKRFTNLEDNNRKLMDMFDNSISRMDKLEEVIVASTKLKPQICQVDCEGLSKKLDTMERKTEVLFDNLEQRMFYQISLSEKLFDRISRFGSFSGTTTATDKVNDPVNTDPEIPDVAVSDCSEIQRTGQTKSGIYEIVMNQERIHVYCDLSTRDGGWTVIQRRGSFKGKQPQNFNQDWTNYKSGFGDLNGEFWLGNENIHRLTDANDVILLVQLEDFDGNTAYAEYDHFSVESEMEKYRLHVGGYRGNASDSLIAHHQKLFSTADHINDEVDPCCSCSLTFEGGWWFYACFESHLNGPYLTNPLDNGYFRGIIWEHWKGDYSLKSTEMKIRPKIFSPQMGNDRDDLFDNVDDP